MIFQNIKSMMVIEQRNNLYIKMHTQYKYSFHRQRNLKYANI